MRFTTYLIAAFVAIAIPARLYAQSFPSWVVGSVYHISATRTGMLVVLDGQIVPNNCTNSPSGHMLISEDESTMISFFLTQIAQGKRQFYFYTDASTSGYCKINQLHLYGSL